MPVFQIRGPFIVHRQTLQFLCSVCAHSPCKEVLPLLNTGMQKKMFPVLPKKLTKQQSPIQLSLYCQKPHFRRTVHSQNPTFQEILFIVCSLNIKHED
ncbi:unnamed protein product [Ixodes persulcatus]